MTDATHPLPEHPPAPDVLGLRWHTTRMTRGYSGPVRLSEAYPTDEFREVWWTDDQAANGLSRLGFRFKADANQVLHWGTADATPLAKVEAVVRDAALRHAEALRVAQDLRERLQHEITTHAWAVHKDKLATARRLLAGSLTRWTPQHEAREVLREFESGLKRAKAAVAKAVAALDPTTVARFADTKVRADVHEACRLMSQADEDWASQQNAVGWSKSTFARGHWLAEVDALTPDLAAVGYALVAVHAKQLTRAMPDLSSDS